MAETQTLLIATLNIYILAIEYNIYNIKGWVRRQMTAVAATHTRTHALTHLCLVTVLVHLKGSLFRAVSSPSAPLFTAALPLRVRAGVYCKEEKKREEKQAAAGPLDWTADGKGRQAGGAVAERGEGHPGRRARGEISGQGREEAERLWVIS